MSDDHDLLIQIKTTLDLVAQQLGATVSDHEDRLRDLDRRVWLLALAATAGGTGGGAVLARLMGA